MDELQNKNVLFETLRVRNGQAEFVEEHLKRLQQSIGALGLKVKSGLSAADISNFLQQNAKSEKIYRLRVFATEQGGRMSLEEYQPLEKKFYTEGISLLRVQHPDLHRARHKFWQRPAYRELLASAERQGFHDALLCVGNELLETATSNFFIVINNEIVVPPRGERLRGVMERVILQKTKLRVREEKILWPLPENALCYITSSLKGVVPVQKIDDRFLLVFPFGEE